MQSVKVSIPDWPYDSLNAIIFAESAAAFEELTLSRQVDQLRVQTPDAWPNTFRQSRFISAVDFVQADRLRRAVAQEMQKLMSQVTCCWYHRYAMRCSRSGTLPACRR